ncbi:MAG: hypothetical protein KJ955_04760 [Nanoarchaeota archaeon]|nr:hypothetical protein [Nanoarchaeota archaeon]
MNKTLAVIVAAAGMAGCARSAPYYEQNEAAEVGHQVLNPATLIPSLIIPEQSETAEAEQQEYVKYVISDSRDRLTLGYAKMHVTSIYDEDTMEWLRVEEDKVCQLERVYDLIGLKWVFVYDDGCDGTFDRIFTNVINGSPNYYVRSALRSAFGEEYILRIDEAFADTRNFFDAEFDIDTQIEEWQARH